ncbi:MAG: hypothetical protein IIX14_08675 [Clostridia bacterium]|nr:hypothetical protein [Clostridia bacterium]
MGSSLEFSKPEVTKDFADGITLSHAYFNASDKAMKYITFTFVPYNRVGDVVYCTISHEAEKRCKITGPISPGETDFPKWETLWYNPTVYEAVLDSVEIIYMDGTEEFIDGKDVTYMHDEENSVYYKQMMKEKAEELEKRAIAQEKAAQKAAERKADQDRKAEYRQAYGFFKVFQCLDKAKVDEEMKFHVNQGLILFIFRILTILSVILTPFIELMSLFLIIFAAISIFLYVKCVGAINEGKKFEIPVLGKIKLIK